MPFEALCNSWFSDSVTEEKAETPAGWGGRGHTPYMAEWGTQTHSVSSLILSFNSFMLNILYLPDIMSEMEIQDK